MKKTIAYLLKKDINDIVVDLQRLDAIGIIQYSPRKDNPRLYFLYNHIKSEDLHINQLNYRQRKEQFKLRVAALIGYAKLDTGCRSQYIAMYFGDIEARPCGICDNCLKAKNSTLSVKEFEQIHQKIIALVTQRSMQATDLLQEFTGINKEKAWKVINHLQAENQLLVDQSGIVQMK